MHDPVEAGGLGVSGTSLGTDRNKSRKQKFSCFPGTEKAFYWSVLLMALRESVVEGVINGQRKICVSENIGRPKLVVGHQHRSSTRSWLLVEKYLFSLELEPIDVEFLYCVRYDSKRSNVCVGFPKNPLEQSTLLVNELATGRFCR